MCNQSDLARIFGIYAGRPVTRDQNDPVARSMIDDATRYGFGLHLLWPDDKGAEHFHPLKPTVVVRIASRPDGTHHIGCDFSLR